LTVNFHKSNVASKDKEVTMMPRYVSALALAIGLLLITVSCGDGGEGETNYPAAGEDAFESTTATVEIEITQEGVSTAPGAFGALEKIELRGPALISRSDPSFDGDIAVVETEIVEMELTGTSPFGPITVRQSPDDASVGEVRQQSAGEDFPATSFFDVFVEIELPDMNLTARNEEPLRMEARLSDLPPAPGDEYVGANDEPLPIFTPAGQQVGRIIDALHIPEPAPAATMEPGPTPTPQSATPTPPPAEPTDTPAEPEPEPDTVLPVTEGGCEHGTGQSVLYIAFSSLQPGQSVTGTVTGPGVIGDGTFSATADADGNALVEVDIGLIGTYTWSAAGVTGSYTVGQTCPGPPGNDGSPG
jgi:hypothetical protein